MAFTFTFQDNTISFDLHGYQWIHQFDIDTCKNPGQITNASGDSSGTICFLLVAPDVYYVTENVTWGWGKTIDVIGPVGDSLIWEEFGANPKKQHKMTLNKEVKQKLEEQAKELGFESVEDALKTLKKGPEGIQEVK